MNKIIKYFLTIILTLLIIKYTIINSITGINYFIFLAVYLLYLILNIKDIIKNTKINENKKYTILQIIVLIIMNLVFIRTLYDPSFIYNSKYLETLKQIESGTYVENTQYQTILYLLQNINYFIGLLLLLLIYRKINMEKQDSKYNTITLICMILSIISIIPSLQCLTGDINLFKYLIFTLILIGVEIYRLIKDNHKRIEWPIYVSWLFNMFAIISILINIILKQGQ